MKYKSGKSFWAISMCEDDKKFLIGVMFGECIYDI